MGGLAVVLGFLAAVGGLAAGRLVSKRDPVWPLCDTCDGASRVRWEVLPWRAPAACDGCGRSVRAPTALLVAAVTAVVPAVQVRGDSAWLLPANLILGGALAGLVWCDARFRLLPARLVWWATAASLPALAMASVTTGAGRFPAALAVAGAAGGVFLVLHLISPAGMAFGDIRLAVLLGLHVGWRSAAAALWGFVLAATLAAVVGALWRRMRQAKTVPFGPFLAIATAAVLLMSGNVSRR